MGQKCKYNEISIKDNFSDRIQALYLEYCVFMATQLKAIIEKIATEDNTVWFNIQVDGKYSDVLICIKHTDGLSPSEIKNIKFDDEVYLIGKEIMLLNRRLGESIDNAYIYIWKLKEFRLYEKTDINKLESERDLEIKLDESYTYLTIKELHPLFGERIGKNDGISYDKTNYNILKNHFKKLLKDINVKKLTFVRTKIKECVVNA